MLTVEILNMTPVKQADGTVVPAEVSDYVFTVLVNGRAITVGHVEGHRRADGWRALLKLIAETG